MEASSIIFVSMVWLDLGLNLSLLDNWGVLPYTSV